MTIKGLSCSLIMMLFACSVSAQEVEVDISACRGMHEVLKAMHDRASKEKVSSMLDAQLETRPYQTMFKHYKWISKDLLELWHMNLIIWECAPIHPPNYLRQKSWHFA